MFSKIAVLRLVASAVLALVVAACGNPVENEHHPVGLVVLNASGQQVATYRVGSATSGQLTVQQGTLTTFTVLAVDEDDEPLEVDGVELGLIASVTTGPATAAIQAADQLVITGSQAGSATVRLTLTHGGHDEFNGDFGVVINP